MYMSLTNSQAKSVIDSEMKFAALRDARVQMLDYVGSMHWKKISNRDYLYRTHDRKGNGRSLGPKSPETEAILKAFAIRKTELSDRVASLTAELETQARVNAAYRAGHVPNPVADICIELDGAGLLDHSITVIGTNSMHVYEAMAGVRFPDGIMSTVDLDLLWNHNKKLSLATNQSIGQEGLIGLLKRADKTFEIMGNQNFRAVANGGYMVDLIRQMPDPPWADEPDRFFEGDLVATDIWNMKWLLGAPRVVQTVLAQNGRPFRMSAPDPRAFAMFKLWLSQADDREPIKKERDLQQARAVIALIEERLPHLSRAWPSLKSFPADVHERAMEAVRVERERQR